MIKKFLIVATGLAATLAALVTAPASIGAEPVPDDPNTVCGVCW